MKLPSKITKHETGTAELSLTMHGYSSVILERGIVTVEPPEA